MKTFIRNLLSGILVMSFLFANYVPVAAQASSPEIYYDYINDCYFTQPIRVENGVARDLSYEEYMDDLIEAKKFDEHEEQFLSGTEINTEAESRPQPRLLTYSYKYDMSGETLKLNTSKTARVSPTITATDVDTTISANVGSSVSETFSGSFGGIFDVKKSIKATVTLSYANSTVKSQVFGMSGVIPKGKTGYIQFTPRMVYTWGDVTRIEYTNYVECHRETSAYTAYLPTKIGDYADGNYVIKLV